MTIALVASMITVLILFCGLAIDTGVGYTARNSVQTAADACALAAAYGMQLSPPNDPVTTGRALAMRNAPLQQTLLPQQVQVTVLPPPAQGHELIECEVAASVPTSFMRVVRVNAMVIDAVADAESWTEGSTIKARLVQVP